ncbi:50S ribosomal protein L25/general stress protein Ctc [Cryptosporangium arvum]|uniref:Large ribosomal subunit protein bL25 n=1 Tax=Cryptosporangium arvum DSM 44712 TaxID=927661 RepID=A0A010ZML9_9ACTN|nr:50S ribosomal protein L25/general stress protein Ctc [Cryptosporangium arvum]EXG79924.1 LSU ribosomal protein L25P [Cryptosporangium arvum DSM 44712]
MSEVRIAAEPRTEFGKGGARRTRRAGKIPAVLYGHGQAPRHIALPAREFTNAIKHGANTLLTIEVDGGKELALAKAVQRDPIKQSIDHVDLLLVRKGEKVTVELAVVLAGEVERGGRVNQDLTSLTVEAEATNIPDGVEVNIDGLQIGHQLLAKDVALPKGVTLITDPEAAVVGVVAQQSAAQAEAEIEAAEAEAGIERDEKQTADA